MRAVRAQLLSNPHSPAAYRVNGVVRNFDPWYAAFNVKPSDKLYLPPRAARPYLGVKLGNPALSG